MAFDINDAADVKILDDKVNEATIGLKNKNNELIGEQKKLKDQVTQINERFAGIDPEVVRKMLGQFEGNEEAKLIAEGKTDELINRRTERMRSDFEKKLQLLEKKNGELTVFAQRTKDNLLAAAIRDAAIKAGCRPEAAEDFALRGRMVFHLDDEGNAVAKKGDDVVFGKDGKTPLQPGEWVESLREGAPHLWPTAAGSGAPGSGSSAANKSFDEMTGPERITLFQKDAVAYRALRSQSKTVKTK